MNRKNGFFSRFLNYIYKGEIQLPPTPIIEVNMIEIEPIPEGEEIEMNKQSQQPKQPSLKVVDQIILNINKLLTAVCLVSFIAMIIYVFIYPDKSIPDVLQNAFFTTLGWLGSAFANFFHIDKNNTKI